MKFGKAMKYACVRQRHQTGRHGKSDRNQTKLSVIKEVTYISGK